MKKFVSAVLFTALVLAVILINSRRPTPRILIFSKTTGYHHSAIAAGQTALLKLASEKGFEADTTTDNRLFRDEVLSSYHAIIFLNTTLDVLDEFEQIAMQRFIEAGGGYVGIHAASDTEYDWPWYGQLVGGYFVSHPAIQEATLHVEDADHPSTKSLPADWIRSDEWYNIRYVNDDIHVVLSIDESTYNTGKEGDPEPHPVAWYHEFDGGRAFYTELGHTEESYADPLFLAHVWGGISWAVGEVEGLDYTLEGVVPNADEFRFTTLEENLNEPMELDILPDGRILYAERRGDVRLFDPKTGQSTIAASLDVFSELENGLLGLAVDPDFASDSWIYLYYSPDIDAEVQYLSRFQFEGDFLDLDTEQVILMVQNQRLECCHSGGSVEFGPNGLLYLSVGDDTNPFASDGFTPIDERTGRSQWDAQRTAANSQDLRGKILRIKPEADGSYSIPKGNLFPHGGVGDSDEPHGGIGAADTPDGGGGVAKGPHGGIGAADTQDGRPEIYIMGNRNPFRISIDQKTSTLYWGEVGPDAARDSTGRGPRGHDEINRATGAGFYGWPYFVGDNKAYYDYNFSTSTSGPAFQAAAPQNNSPNNRGTRALPAAQPAFIWYPYDTSVEFPMLGDGGRTAMAGPVYYGASPVPRAVSSENRGAFPPYYHGKLFIYEWMRHFIKVVSMDDNGSYRYMESFLPGTTLARPIDMIFAPDGSMYLLEYGTAWNARNEDARLVHIEFIRQ